MKYLSTRGGSDLLTFEEAVLSDDWKSYSFVDLSVAVLSLYIAPDELSREELRALVSRSYTSFRHPDVTPLTKLSDNEFILELFHGPTFSFKDVALQLLGNLFEFFLARRNARKSAGERPDFLTVVGATSGDTGSAAIYGLRGKKNVSIFILHPKGRISPVQEAQMTTVTDSNVCNIAVKGTFDACQDIVKALFADQPFNEKYHLGAVNSINWARILAQTVYYFLAYFQVRRQIPQPESSEIQFVVPTGNLGSHGPSHEQTRRCDKLERHPCAFWRSGRYEQVDSTPEVTPLSKAPQTGSHRCPAMDILVSSNFERLLWYLVVKSNGRVEVPVEVLELARRDFLAERVSDDQTLETIKQYFIGSPSYIADPHTSVALTAARTPAVRCSVVLSTAHPAKFSEAVTKALVTSRGLDFERDVLPQEFRGLLELERRVVDVDEPTKELVKKVIESRVGN
ncbi:tryptophan synthase beta subunit-like PLP-dependent enzyme [Russula vinacea]|nr:tryptophan synthase beta subunit-like PLP-dependent enzyme [Russula vinacea]